MKDIYGLESIQEADRPKLLQTQLKKLKELEDQFYNEFDNNPRKGHGGTPNIIDNTKGRQMIKVCEKHQNKLIRIDENIKLQKEKINRTISRYFHKNTETKKSIKFIDKNPIEDILLKMEIDGKVQQWKRNKMFFFVTGLKKVALMTVSGKVGISQKYRTTNQEDFEYCKNLIKEYGGHK